MKNKQIYILFLLIVTVSTSVTAQNRYKIQYQGTRNTDCLADTYYILLKEGSGVNVSTFGPNAHEIARIDKNSSTNTTYNVDEVLNTSIDYAQVHKFSDGSNSGCVGMDPSPPFLFTAFDCTSSSFSFIWRGVDWDQRIVYELESLTIYNPSSTGLTLFDCEPLPVQFAPLCDSRYRVEYQFGNNTSSWSTLLPYAQRDNRVDINFSDFSGLQAGQNIRLRVRYNNSPPFEYSDILTISTLRCAPVVTNISIENTTCVYTNDGGFTLTFNRPLEAGERLANLGYETPGPNGVFEPSSASSTDDILFNLNPNFATYSGTQYVFPIELSTGRYRFIYQSEFPALNIITSAEETNDIIISSPPPLEYNVTINSEISCFESNDLILLL